MLLLVEKNLCRASSRLFRRFSVALESTLAHRDESSSGEFVEKNEEFTRIRSEADKSLRVAIIGLPNVGKSTLINRLIKRPVCATAAKIHLTRSKADAVYSEKNTQLVFIDTPGLVSAHEFKKFHMEESFRVDAAESMARADIVGVVQDAFNKHTRGIIHNRVLELLKSCRVGVPSVLIINKVDMMKHKRELLALVKHLTSERGWPNFSDVFMVSALRSDGIDDFRNYLLDSAKLRDWEYAENVVSDQTPERIMELCVRAKLMDLLPEEIPYLLKIEMEHMNTCADGSLTCFLKVSCPSDRIARIVMGKGGHRIRIAAHDSEQELSNAFRTPVRMKIAVDFQGDPKPTTRQ